MWEGDYTSNPVRVISFLRAKKMFRKGCLAFLAHLRDDTIQVPSIESVSIVRRIKGSGVTNRHVELGDRVSRTDT